MGKRCYVHCMIFNDLDIKSFLDAQFISNIPLIYNYCSMKIVLNYATFLRKPGGIKSGGGIGTKASGINSHFNAHTHIYLSLGVNFSTNYLHS